MRSSGANTGSKLWIGAPLSVQPGALGAAAMASFLAHAVPSTLTVQIANGSVGAVARGERDLVAFPRDRGMPDVRGRGGEPGAPADAGFVQAPPPGVMAPVVASMARGVKQRSDDARVVREILRQIGRRDRRSLHVDDARQRRELGLFLLDLDPPRDDAIRVLVVEVARLDRRRIGAKRWATPRARREVVEQRAAAVQDAPPSSPTVHCRGAGGSWRSGGWRSGRATPCAIWLRVSS